MCHQKVPLATSCPTILVINRKGNCRTIQADVCDECAADFSDATLENFFNGAQTDTIHTLTEQVLRQQMPKPLILSFSEPSQSYFGYLFPLSLASVLLMLQPVEAFRGQSKEKAMQLFPLPMLLYDPQTLRIGEVNQVAIDQYGYSKTEFLQMTLAQLHPGQMLPSPLQDVSQLVTGQWQHYRKDGKLVHMAVSAYPIQTPTDNCVLLTAQDITEYEYAKTALQEQQHSALTHHFPPCGILCFDNQWYYTLAAGEAVTQMTQATMAEGEKAIEGQPVQQVLSPQLRNRFQSLQQQILWGQFPTQSFTNHQYTYYLQGYPLTNPQGEITGGLLFVQNLTPGKQLEALLEKHALYDSSTRLPNQTWLLETISSHLHVDQQLALILVKLERYGVIKYGLGLQWAEQLVLKVAQRLKTTRQLPYDLARVGDADVAMILPNLYQKQDIEKIAQLIHFQLNLPLTIQDQELFCPVSVGVAVYDPSSDDPLQTPLALLHAADTAMNSARGEATVPYVIFHPYLHQLAASKVQLETELRQALRFQQLQVFFQPTVQISDGKLVGFEALVRWQHPKRGLVSPDYFIPLAYELGLIGFIDWWVLAEACEKLATWQQMVPDHHLLSMNVNLSENMINQVGVLERLDKITQRTGISPDCLKLEITEEMILEGKDSIMNVLQQLRETGFLLSIDDFGTGYSSLKRLHQLPIHSLKIDRSFTQRMLQKQEIRQIVTTIINLAHNLNMDVIAEGIENQQQWAFLQSLNCKYGQGFLFSKPLSAEYITQLIQSHQDELKIK